MSKTLAELITILRFRGDLRNTVRFPDTNLGGELQAAFARGYAIVVKQNSGFFDTTANASTAAGTAFVALPVGPPVCWIVRAVDRLEGTDYVPVPRIGIKDRNRYGSTRGKPVAHRLTAQGIDLYPTPDAIYTLRVTYTPVAPTLDTTAREFYNSWEEYAISGALVRLYKNQGRDASIWERDLAAAELQIVEDAAQRDDSGPEYLNLHDGWSSDDADDVDRWRPGF